jgi:hypothetical protein
LSCPEASEMFNTNNERLMMVVTATLLFGTSPSTSIDAAFVFGRSSLSRVTETEPGAGNDPRTNPTVPPKKKWMARKQGNTSDQSLFTHFDTT